MNIIDRILRKVEKPRMIRLEIDAQKIQDLLANRQLCAADFHCLDGVSHRYVRDICLQTCLRTSMNPKAGE